MTTKDIFVTMGIAIFISSFLFAGGVLPRIFSTDSHNAIDVGLNNQLSAEALKSKQLRDDAALKDHCKNYFSSNIHSRLHEPFAVINEAESNSESGRCDDIFKCVIACNSKFKCKLSSDSALANNEPPADCLSNKKICLIDCGK